MLYQIPFLNDLERHIAFGLSHLENLGSARLSLASLSLIESGIWCDSIFTQSVYDPVAEKAVKSHIVKQFARLYGTRPPDDSP